MAISQGSFIEISNVEDLQGKQLLRIGIIKAIYTFHDLLKQWNRSVTKRGPSARPPEALPSYAI